MDILIQLNIGRVLKIRVFMAILSNEVQYGLRKMDDDPQADEQALAVLDSVRF